VPQVTLQNAMAEVYEGNASANFTLVRSGDIQIGATVFFKTRQAILWRCSCWWV